jgi:hypothetical protein
MPISQEEKEIKKGVWLPTYRLSFDLSCDCGWKPCPFCTIQCDDIHGGPWYCPNCGKELKSEPITSTKMLTASIEIENADITRRI